MPASTIINAVIHAVHLSAHKPPAKVLDLSCGDGDILERLSGLGYSVEGTHYREDDYITKVQSPILKQATIHTGIDLNQPLPFEDAQYDIVLATEVLEHLPAHAPLLKEIGRILNDGGVFIFSTPNIHRLSSRVQFLFTGTHNMCGAYLGWHVAPDDLYSTHFNPVYFPVIHTLLKHNELKVEKLGFTSGSFSMYLLFPFLYPFIAISTLIEVAPFWKRSKSGGKDLLRWLLSPVLLMSNQLVVRSRKTSTL